MSEAGEEKVDANAGARVQETLVGPAEPVSGDPARTSRRRRAVGRLAPELRPPERLLSAGPGALSSAELLGLLFFGVEGGEGPALESAAEVISASGGLFGLAGASVFDLLEVRGVGEEKACVILAVVELGKRLTQARNPGRPVVSSPADVDALLRGRIARLDREHFVVVLLNTRNEVIGCPTVSVGTLSSSLVHPREVFKPAIKASAASVILAHNHPSGKVEPSREDREVTERLAQTGEVIGIGVLDHVILGDGYLSLKERGML